MSMRFSTTDAAKLQEGMFYASQLLSKSKEEISTQLNYLRQDGVMSGETGEEYVKSITAQYEVLASCAERISALSRVIDEKCVENGMHLNNAALDFEQSKSKLSTVISDISTFKGK